MFVLILGCRCLNKDRLSLRRAAGPRDRRLEWRRAQGTSASRQRQVVRHLRQIGDQKIGTKLLQVGGLAENRKDQVEGAIRSVLQSKQISGNYIFLDYLNAQLILISRLM